MQNQETTEKNTITEATTTLEELKVEIAKELKEFNSKSDTWERKLLGTLQSATKGKGPLVPGFKDKTTIVPLARLQIWVEQQINILNQQLQQSIQGMYPVFQNFSKQITDLKGMVLALDIKSEALQRLNNISSEDLEKMMDFITKEREVEAEAKQDIQVGRKVVDRVCKEKDVVKIDFLGTIEGKPFPGGKSDGYHLTLGSKTMIDGFEEQIIGMKAGDKKDISVVFPEDYGNREVAGKEATFAITVHSVKEMIKKEESQKENEFNEKN